MYISNQSEVKLPLAQGGNIFGDFDCLYIDKHMHYTSQLSSEDFVTTSHETEFTSC